MIHDSYASHDSYETSTDSMLGSHNKHIELFPIEVPRYLGSGRLGALRPAQADREALAGYLTIGKP